MTPRRNAVITIHLGTAMHTMAELTIPTMRAYAGRIDADFIVIDKIPAAYEFLDYSAYWAKFILRDYLETYERIIYLDLDTIVSRHCPNLFERVPEADFGALAEDDYGIDQQEEMASIQQRCGHIGWRKDYFNVGVMVFSQAHKKVFELHRDMLSGTKYPEQTAMNYNLQKAGISLHKLSHKFNHMYFLEIDQHQRHLSYISHYAGMAQQLREAIIAEDLRRAARGQPLVVDHLTDEFVHSYFTPQQLREMVPHSLLKDEQVFEEEAEPA